MFNNVNDRVFIKILIFAEQNSNNITN